MNTYDRLLDADYEVEIEGDNGVYYTFYANLEWPGEYNDDQWDDLPHEIEITEEPTFDILAVLDDRSAYVEVPHALIKRATEIMQNIYWDRLFND